MSAPLGTVIAASVLVSSPVLWMLQSGTLTPAEALERWGICLAMCWIAITLVSTFAFPDARPTTPAAQPVEQDEPVHVPQG